ncbi:hypothetical protein FWD20_01895 [Candidatus Saccharibacteria bacterium]|nr:hypothetical protein [Candidatus Saccharibacteria bacterium]
MNEKTPRSQLVAKVKDASSILVTVSRDPSVDQLAAALALTFALSKIGKSTTAVFSGEIPAAINFLEPEKTFENSVDSLRDFVISLDKEKADRLRYKVEGDFVKIYITPYKTTISEKDLDFNEGDFNIELVIAIGVKNKDHLDEAITSHGGLLHDAAVATMTLSDNDRNAFGTINWQNTEASCLSEMVADLVEDLSDKDNPLLDEHVATALLTGVVAATDQFRNDRTSASIMTLAANLMAKGANQQLIASELSAAGGSLAVAQEDSDEPSSELPTNEPEPGVLSIDRNLTPEEENHLAANTEAVAEENNQAALEEAESRLAAAAEAQSPPPEEINPADLPPLPAPEPTVPAPEPTAPGESELNNIVANSSPILSHAVPYAESVTGPPLNSAVAGNDEPALVDPLGSAPLTTASATAPMINAAPAPTLTPPAIDLPPPPPPPAPDLGQLPPLPPPSDTATVPEVPLDAALSSVAPEVPVPEQAPPSDAPSDPMFPGVTNPADPTQYQIPGQ